MSASWMQFLIERLMVRSRKVFILHPPPPSVVQVVVVGGGSVTRDWIKSWPNFSKSSHCRLLPVRLPSHWSVLRSKLLHFRKYFFNINVNASQQVIFLKIAPKSPNIWATFVRNILAKNVYKIGQSGHTDSSASLPRPPRSPLNLPPRNVRCKWWWWYSIVRWDQLLLPRPPPFKTFF